MAKKTYKYTPTGAWVSNDDLHVVVGILIHDNENDTLVRCSVLEAEELVSSNKMDKDELKFIMAS